jgi:hypothetical protein
LPGSWAALGKPVLMTKGGLMSKLVIGLAAFVLLAAGGALAGGALTDTPSDDGVSTVATTDDTTTLGTTTTDETTTTTRTETGEDVRGPCDEAEHANDPRCTGVGTTEDDHRGDEDRSGPNRGPDRRGHDDRDDDRSGSNSGRG